MINRKKNDIIDIYTHFWSLKMKILHTADLHIGAELSFLGADADSRKYEVLEVFKSITELCRTQNVEICLIAGDLFDSNRAAKVFAEPVFRAISETENTRFFLVAGNHDPLDASSPYLTEKLPENLTVFGGEYETVELPEKGVRICGRSFTHASMDFKYMPSMADDGLVNLLLLHSDFGATGSVYNPISTDFVENCGADYLALGHIHKRTEVERVGKTFVSYSGCPEGQGFDEAGEKGVYLGEISKGLCSLEFVPCSKRQHLVKKVDVSLLDSVGEIADGIIKGLEAEFGANYGKNLYKLILVGAKEYPESVNASELLSMLSPRLYFVKIRNRITKKLDLELIAKETSLKGIFVKKMLERIKNSEGEEQKRLANALYLGLKAFDTEVAFDED